jgi:hypothetical protein
MLCESEQIADDESPTLVQHSEEKSAQGVLTGEGKLTKKSSQKLAKNLLAKEAKLAKEIPLDDKKLPPWLGNFLVDNNPIARNFPLPSSPLFQASTPSEIGQ